ncbi:MAG: indole-3-glycerol phosphate synthase TrpC [Planctomycetia bacterium]|nr:indole-3-glycerol phosphate synthase TrpC [Planctomycetia bacterium]
MSTILDRIVVDKQREIAERRAALADSALEARLADAPPVRDFFAALNRAESVQIIAEVKKASPSVGLIRADFDPVAIAETYCRHGAAGISVLTDAPYFQGELSYLTRIRACIETPLLRKDFILDRYQLLEARVAGADAVLLIAEILDDRALNTLLRETHALGMHALVELYDAENLPRVVDSGAKLIGVNNRNLRTFVTQLEHTLELAARVPPDRLLVSESGIRSRADIQRLRQAGVRAVLIGETLMASPNIGKKLDELRGVTDHRTP